MVIYFKCICTTRRLTNLREDWNGSCGAEEKQYACADKQGLPIEKFDTQVLNLLKVHIMNNKIFRVSSLGQDWKEKQWLMNLMEA